MTLRVLVADDQAMVRSGFRMILEASGMEVVADVGDGRRAVIVTTFDLDEYLEAALANGASGFLLKDAGPALLVEAVQAAARGDALVSPSITVRLLKRLADQAPAAAPVQPVDVITEREEEVLRAAAIGRTNAEIGEDLFISLSTVKTHLASLQAKVGARNRVELAAWAWSTGRMR
jgi:DNA-binding NarL/FixJ family response regulator